MELDVLHLDGLATSASACGLKHDLVIETKTELRHTTEVAFHLDGTENLGSQDVAVGGDEQVETFDDIEEDFVLAVSDSF